MNKPNYAPCHKWNPVSEYKPWGSQEIRIKYYVGQILKTGFYALGCDGVSPSAPPDRPPLSRLSWASHERDMRPVPCPLLKTTRSLIHSKQRFSVTTKRGGVEKKDKETVKHAIMLTSVREQIRLFTFSFFLSKHTHTAKICGSKDKREFFFTQMLPSEFSSKHTTWYASVQRYAPLSLRRCAPVKCRTLSDVALRVPLLHLLLDLDLHHVLRGLAVLLAPHCRHTIKSLGQN